MKKIFLLTLLATTSINVFAQFYVETAFQSVCSVFSSGVTANNSVIWMGYIWSGSDHAFIIKADSMGIFKSSKRMATTTGLPSSIFNGEVNDDETILMTYSVYPFSPALHNIVEKTDPDLNKIWSYVYTDTTTQYTLQRIEKVVGGAGKYLFAGFGIDTSGGNSINDNLRIFETDTNGNIQWVKSVFVNALKTSLSNQIIRANNGGYLGTGFDNSNTLYYLTDSLFNFQWIRKINVQLTNGFRIVQTTGNEIYVISAIGDTSLTSGTCSTNAFKNILVCKINPLDGSVLWSRIIQPDFPIQITSVASKTSDGNIIIGGTYFNGTCYFNSIKRFGFAVKIDTAANVIWSDTLNQVGTNYNYEILSIKEKDNKLFLMGNRWSDPNPYPLMIITDTSALQSCLLQRSDFYTLGNTSGIIDSAYSAFNLVPSPLAQIAAPDTSYDYIYSPTYYCCITGIYNPETHLVISVFPNPVTEFVNILVESLNTKQISLSIKNVLGQNIFNKQESNPSNVYKKTIDLSFLSKGIYLLEINIDGKRTVKKIVKE